MANEHYQRAKAIYYQVSEMDPSERAAFLDNACSGDEALRRDIDSLLRVDDNGQFLQQPALDEGQLLHRAVAQLSSDLGSCRLPVAFGRYRVLRLISEGGMGSVYEAEQDSPHRIVALKVIRSAFPSKQMVQRFEREIQILGRLHHPNIAQIYDADASELSVIGGAAARPAYYTMELISGLPLTEHANQEGLTDRQSLNLLAKICDAVHFGHTHGVVHRDLKPSNILVEATGEPKIIDFGVASATNLDQMATVLNTRSGALIGTLAYMSPEQITGDSGSGGQREGNSIDGRGDVYALGVIAYELLGGRLPYDLAGRSIPESARIIRDEEPSSLSSISHAYRGDVETIVRRAMAKEPSRRYQTAAELAADIRRFLNDQPILARPPTIRYQMEKFARRHKELVAGLALVLLVFIAGVVATATGWMRAIQSATEARHDAAMAMKTTAVLQSILAYAKPGMEGGGRDVWVVDMLTASAQNLSEQLQGFPEIETVAQRTLGETYFSLGYYDEAETSLRRALKLTAGLGPGHDEAAISIQERLAKTLLSAGIVSKKKEGGALARSTFKEALVLLGPTHRVTQLAHLALCDAMLTEAWNSPEIVPTTSGLIDVLKSLPEEQRAVSLPAVMWRLVTAYWMQGRIGEVEDIKNGALSLQEMAGPGRVDHETESLQLSALGWIAHAQGHLDECAHMFGQLLELQRGQLGSRHPSPMSLQSELATVLARLGRLEEALALQRDDLQAFEGRDSKSRLASKPEWAWNLHMYIAALLDRLGRTAESRAEFAAGIATGRDLFGDANFLTQEVWRTGTMRIGLRIQRPWASEALRTHVRQMAEDLLLANPSHDLDLDEIDWSKLHWSIDALSADPHVSGLKSDARDLPGGGLNELWTADDPRPGLHKVSLSLDCSESGPLSASAWMLVAHWNLQLFLVYKTFTLDQWETALRGPPAETQTLPALALAGWWGTGEGFGPKHADYSFGVVATATVEWPAGQYRLLVDADDCVRVFIDGQLVIERWGADHEFSVETAVIQSDGGPQTIRVEYWQDGGDSRLWVRAEPLD